jgi:hypothetical protein
VSSVTPKQAAEVDWPAAIAIAEGLGRRTLLLVAERDATATREWCLQMAETYVSEGNALRSASYMELAVVVGYRKPGIEKPVSRSWRELAQATQQLAATVALKADAEAKAAEETARAEAAARAEAETEAETEGDAEAAVAEGQSS